MNDYFTADFKPGLQSGSGVYIKEELSFCDVPDFVTDIKTEIQEADETCNALRATIKQESDPRDSGWSSENTEEQCIKSNLQASCANEELSKGDDKIDAPKSEDYTSQKTPDDDTQLISKEKRVKQKTTGKITFYQCPDCEYGTKYKRGLNRHIICRHKSLDEVEIFKCNSCVYQSNDKFKMKRHLRIHQPEERHFLNCPHCHFRTIHHSALKNHVIRHKNVNEIETYKCLECDYTTIIRSRLNRHSLKHKKFKTTNSSAVPTAATRPF